MLSQMPAPLLLGVRMVGSPIEGLEHDLLQLGASLFDIASEWWEARLRDWNHRPQIQ